MIENIPLGINRRLCAISSNKEVFLEAAPPYQAELERCGYTYKLIWMEEEELQKKKQNVDQDKLSGSILHTVSM